MISAILVVAGIALCLGSPLCFLIIESEAVAICIALFSFGSGLTLSIYAYDRGYSRHFDLDNLLNSQKQMSVKDHLLSSGPWGHNSARSRKSRRSSSAS